MSASHSPRQDSRASNGQILGLLLSAYENLEIRLVFLWGSRQAYIIIIIAFLTPSFSRHSGSIVGLGGLDDRTLAFRADGCAL